MSSRAKPSYSAPSTSWSSCAPLLSSQLWCVVNRQRLTTDRIHNGFFHLAHHSLPELSFPWGGSIQLGGFEQTNQLRLLSALKHVGATRSVYS